MQVDINPGGKPKRGSFEILMVKKSSEKEILLWSGLTKGPPRRLKFPEASEVVELCKKNVGED